MAYPLKTQNGWVDKIRDLKFWHLFVSLILLYILINMMFAWAAWYLKIFKCKETETFDWIYFSFVTSTTLGYGDFAPKTLGGKILVVSQVVVMTIYFTGMMSLIIVKLLYPRNAIYFSTRLCYDKSKSKYSFRVINTNASKLVNPDIRIIFVPHHIGNEIALHTLVKKYDNLCWLGKHDFTVYFDDTISPSLHIFEELQKANTYNKTVSKKEEKSRCRIKVSITGSYAFQQYMHFTKYSADDIVNGTRFRPIQYDSDYERRKGIINYQLIPGFWDSFNAVE